MTRLHSLIATGSLALTALAAGSASAAVIGVIPKGATNDYIGPSNQVEGLYGASVYLDAASELRIDYFGAEAGYSNQFTLGAGACVFNHAGGNTFGSGALASCTTSQGPGLLNFRFDILSTGASVVNGANPDNSAPGANYFVSFAPLDMVVNGSTAFSGPGFFLFLDDGGGGNDDDHDDMVLQVTARNGTFTTVPEPGTLALLGLGLAGLGLARRKRAA